MTKLGHTPLAAVEENRKEAACEETGSYDMVVYCGTCGEELERTSHTIKAKQHAWNDGEVTTAPTCTEAGVKTYTCQNDAGHTYTEAVTKLGHTPLAAVEENRKEAACEETGSYDMVVYCDTCGEELERKSHSIEETGHTEETIEAVAPTCTETGLTEGVLCSVCKKVLKEQEVVEETGHDMAPATCTEPASCKNENCAYTEGEALGHKAVIDEEVPALCEDDGLTEGSHCEVCNKVLIAQEPIKAEGHQIVYQDSKRPTYTGVGWEAYEACTNCGYSTYVEIPALEEPVIEDYDTFLMYLSMLEELAANYVRENPGKDPAALVIKYIRTGVDRYNSGSWGIMAGYEDAGFAKYVSELEDGYNAAVESEEEMMAVSSLKNIRNFNIPNGDYVDMGHVFGTMDITYHNNFGLNHADVAGWAGDIVDLLSLSDQFGVTGTMDEMVADITQNYLLKDNFPAKPIEGSFNQTDMYGDLDGYYIMQQLKNREYESGTLSGILQEYFTETLNDVDRASYFLHNRLGGVSLRTDIRTAVYNAYTGNQMIKTLEDTREFTSDDLTSLKKACCYAFADYLCRLAGDFVEVTENPYFSVFSSESSTLAPGITQEIRYATSADGKQMAYYLATGDLTRSDVRIYANYTNNDPSTWAMSRVLDQANAAQAKYGDPESEYHIANYNVIASINGAGYNMATGEPGGVLVMGGTEYHAINGNGFFGILKDGTPVIGTTEEYNTIYKDQVQEAIAGFGSTLIKNGKICVTATNNYYADRASRTAIGITRTGKVVFMVLDGRQEPFSCGGSMIEIAQIMLEAGCVNAVNLDGGGSTTFVAKQEGENALSVVNRPSDGSARSVSTSLIMVSTAPSSTAFDHAILEAETNYMTVGSSQQFRAEGVSATGNAADIPQGTTWAVFNDRWGTITEDGVFTALRTGNVDVHLMLGDEVIGSKTMNIVAPDNIYFTKSKIDVVYGETVTLPVRALYEGKTVTIQPNDVIFALDNPAAGTVDGFRFTGSEEGQLKTARITVSLANDTSVTASISVALYNQGEASFDFDQATGGDRMFAWDRKVSNATTKDAITYSVVNPDEEMVTSYIFAIDMTQIPIPQQLEDLTYMLPGSDLESASAWTFLMQLAQRVSVLTEVRPVIQFDPNFNVDYSNLTLVNEYFDLKEVTMNEETNVMTMKLKWKKQTQAIDVNDANPMCIVSGIRLTPKEDAVWNAKDALNAVHSGEVGYDVYLRASSLYSFAQKPENQAVFGLKPYSNPEDSSDAGASFGDIYDRFEDTYTLVRTLKNGWTNEAGGFAYYVDGVKQTGIRLVDGYYYDFGENGINVGQTKYTGVFFDENANAYRGAKLGVPVTGWTMLSNEWYYFRSNGNAVSGKYSIDGIEYTFEENGCLTTGVWLETEKGTMYSYGPAFHYEGWKIIEGKTYYFENHYRYEGWHPVEESNSHRAEWYDFGDDGAMIAKLDYTGLYELDGNLYYIVDGLSQHGLFLIDGYYYYFRSDYTAVTGSYYVTKHNDLLPSDTYEFDADHRMIRKTGIFEEEGTLYYYLEGKKHYAGLIQIGDDYYYVNGKGIVVTGRYKVTKHNGLMPSGDYFFEEDGRMSRKNGIVREGDTLYYYVDGERTYIGLTRIGDDYYYVNGKGIVVTGKYYVTRNNGLMPSATYNFDENGRLVFGTGIYTEGDTMYYYQDNERTYVGLIKIGDDYYYVNGKCIVVTGSYYVTRNNGLLPSATYNFDEQGRMIIQKDGIYTEDGVMYYYVNGGKYYAGLIQIDDDYYYVNGKGIVVTGRYYVTRNNGLLPSASYDFDETGRMIREDGTAGAPEVKEGIHTEDGTMYYYINGEKAYVGLIRIGDDYYYVNGKCIVVTGRYYVTRNNGLMPSAYYNFDASGRMIVE